MGKSTQSPLRVSSLEIKDLCLAFRISGRKVFHKEPERCPYCNSDEGFCGIEILGAHNGPLFWECESCKRRLLRFTEKTTIKKVKSTDELFYDLEKMEEDLWLEIPN